jgi:hypothetical protein
MVVQAYNGGVTVGKLIERLSRYPATAEVTYSDGAANMFDLPVDGIRSDQDGSVEIGPGYIDEPDPQSRDEFIQQYCEHKGKTWEQVSQTHACVRCRCGESGCTGWAMIIYGVLEDYEPGGFYYREGDPAPYPRTSIGEERRDFVPIRVPDFLCGPIPPITLTPNPDAVSPFMNEYDLGEVNLN